MFYLYSQQVIITYHLVIVNEHITFNSSIIILHLLFICCFSSCGMSTQILFYYIATCSCCMHVYIVIRLSLFPDKPMFTFYVGWTFRTRPKNQSETVWRVLFIYKQRPRGELARSQIVVLRLQILWMKGWFLYIYLIWSMCVIFAQQKKSYKT